MREVSRIDRRPTPLSRRPLQQPLAQTMRQVKAIVEARQAERAKGVGIEDRRTKAVGMGPYRLTPASNFDTRR